MSDIILTVYFLTAPFLKKDQAQQCLKGDDTLMDIWHQPSEI